MDAQTLLLSLLVVISAATPGCDRQDNIRPKTAAAGSNTCHSVQAAPAAPAAPASPACPLPSGLVRG